MWQPSTEAQILIAIDDGNIVENHHIDAKAIIGDAPRARKNTAQDFASFAIDGGALIIGISEDGPGAFSAAPFALDRDVERAEQIAANLVDPPLIHSSLGDTVACAPC